MKSKTELLKDYIQIRCIVYRLYGYDTNMCCDDEQLVDTLNEVEKEIKHKYHERQYELNEGQILYMRKHGFDYWRVGMIRDMCSEHYIPSIFNISKRNERKQIKSLVARFSSAMILMDDPYCINRARANCNSFCDSYLFTRIVTNK